MIQTFDWAGTFGPQDPGRMPTAQEVEDMGVSALQAGAPHIWCYCDPDYRSLASAMPGIISRWREVAAAR